MRPSTFTIAVAVLVASAAAATARERRGPEFGNRKIAGEIASLTERPDVDDFVSELAAGESLSIKLGVAKKSALRLDVSVLDPDGVDRTAEGKVKVKKGGAKVSISGLPVDVTGPWTVRIAGQEGTEGEYSAKFKVKNAKPLKLKKQRLGGADPAERTHSFGALDGSLVTLTVKGSKKGALPVVRDLRGPLGTVTGLFGEEDTGLALKGTSTKVKKHPLDAGTGSYALVVGADDAAEYSLKLAVTPPARPRGKFLTNSTSDPHLDPFDAPIRTAAGQVVTIRGRNFSVGPFPEVWIGSRQAIVRDVGPARNTIDVVVPAGPDDTTQDVLVVNPDGQAAFAEEFVYYVRQASIDSITIVAGPVLHENVVLLAGGAELEIAGADFQVNDQVVLNDTVVSRSSATDTSFRVTVPAGEPGTVNFLLTDEFGRTLSFPGVVHRAGFLDQTATRSPGSSEVDDLSATAIAIGDLDGDARVDDIVLGTYNSVSRPYPEFAYEPIYGYVEVVENSVGTRYEYLRSFSTDNLGVLDDVTLTTVPVAGSDPAGVQDWNAREVAIGDLDGENGPDVILAGSRGATDSDMFASVVRVLLADDEGAFTFDAGQTRIGIRTDEADVTDETYVPPPPDPPEGYMGPPGLHPIGLAGTGPDVAVALAVGDVDGDLRPDVVAGLPGHGYRYLHLDPSYIDYSQTPPYAHSSDFVSIEAAVYFSGTRLLANRYDAGSGLVDVSEQQLPSVGTANDTPRPAFPARDLALGDVDGDTDLDLVVTFNNPAAVIPASSVRCFGRYTAFGYEYRYDPDSAERTIATRILVNDGSGTFTDATEDWMPAAVGDELWHAHRLAFEDLDGDGDRDLVLLHRRDLRAHRFDRSDPTTPAVRGSFRVLRNDGPDVGFVDVTPAALPVSLRDFRGNALTVGDLDMDGRPEIVVGTRNALAESGGATVSSLHVLWNQPGAGLAFVEAPAFAPFEIGDSGEVSNIAIADMDRDGLAELILTSEHPPATRADGEMLRIFEWQR